MFRPGRHLGRRFFFLYFFPPNRFVRAADTPAPCARRSSQGWPQSSTSPDALATPCRGLTGFRLLDVDVASVDCAERSSALRRAARLGRIAAVSTRLWRRATRHVGAVRRRPWSRRIVRRRRTTLSARLVCYTGLGRGSRASSRASTRNRQAYTLHSIGNPAHINARMAHVNALMASRRCYKPNSLVSKHIRPHLPGSTGSRPLPHS